MARDVRKLDVIGEMRARNRMFRNPSKYVVTKSEEFYSKNPIFNHIPSGMPKSNKKNDEPVEKPSKVEKNEGDRTLNDLLTDLNEEPVPEPTKEDEGSGTKRGSETSGTGAKRGREPCATSSSSSGGRDDGGAKRARSGGTKEEEAEEASQGEVGRGRKPDSEEETQVEPPVCSSQDLPLPDAGVPGKVE